MQQIPATNPWLAAVEPSPIGETKRWVLSRTFPADRPLIDLSQAVPGYPPAMELRRHLGELLLDPTMHGYTPILGLPALRENYAAHLSSFYGAPITAGEVGITSGCNQAFCLALMSIAKAGDQVILPRPHYFNHDMWLRMQGVEPVSLDFRPGSGAVPNAEDAAKLIGPKTRAIVLISPNNPTGAVYPRDTIHAFYELAQQHGIALLLDETYKDFLPEGARPHELFSDPDWRGTLVHLYSFSKVFALTGYRVGGVTAGAGADRRDREGDGLRVDLPAAAGPGGGALWPEEPAALGAQQHRGPEGARRPFGQRPAALQPLAAGQHRRLLRLCGASLCRPALDRRVQAAGRRGEPAHHPRRHVRRGPGALRAAGLRQCAPTTRSPPCWNGWNASEPRLGKVHAARQGRRSYVLLSTETQRVDL